MFLKVEGGQAFPRSTMAYHRLFDMAECVTPLPRSWRCLFHSPL